MARAGLRPERGLWGRSEVEPRPRQRRRERRAAERCPRLCPRAAGGGRAADRDVGAVSDATGRECGRSALEKHGRVISARTRARTHAHARPRPGPGPNATTEEREQREGGEHGAEAGGPQGQNQVGGHGETPRQSCERFGLLRAGRLRAHAITVHTQRSGRAFSSRKIVPQKL